MELGETTRIMGVLNVTPDSFSDGGAWVEMEAAIGRALEMLDQGADILDIGGESTRPGAVPVSATEEQARVMPVVRGILRARPDAVLSIDTYRSDTAKMAVEAGAEIVNDVSGGSWDPAMAGTCAQLGCGTILMHTRGKPQQWRTQPAIAPGDVVPMVRRELAATAERGLAAGIAREALALDPGFGFGKLLEENYPLLAGLGELQELGYPLVAGVSRKGFLRHTLEQCLPAPGSVPPESLRDATIAANVAAVLGGAHVVRVHDVAHVRRAVAVADRVLKPVISQ